MPKKASKRRVKTGGRKSGTPNKRTDAALAKLAEKGFDGLGAVVDIYLKLKEELDDLEGYGPQIKELETVEERLEARYALFEKRMSLMDRMIKATATALPYQYPKRSTVTLQGDDETDNELIVIHRFRKAQDDR